MQLFELCGLSDNTKLALLYRGTRDGFGAKEFHLKCDDVAKTLTIIKTTLGHVFGGYTEQTWGGPDGYANDPNAFLFSFNEMAKLIVLPIRNGQAIFAMFRNPSSGPTFGSGPDIFISDYSNRNNYSIQNPNPCSYGKQLVSWNFLVRQNITSTNMFGQPMSNQNFQVAEIETFKLNKC